MATVTKPIVLNESYIEQTQAVIEALGNIAGKLYQGNGVVAKQVTQQSSGEITIEPNKMYEFANALTDQLTINLEEAITGLDNEWDFQVTQGETTQTIVLPSITWGSGFAPTFSANSTTVCRLYKIGDTLCGEWVTI